MPFKSIKKAAFWNFVLKNWKSILLLKHRRNRDERTKNFLKIHVSSMLHFSFRSLFSLRTRIYFHLKSLTFLSNGFLFFRRMNFFNIELGMMIIFMFVLPSGVLSLQKKPDEENYIFNF